MSWKSFVSAGLLCLLVSPAFAAPTVQAVAGGNQASGHLNTSGDWVWIVRLHQSNPPVDLDNAGPIEPGSPLAAELGFTATGRNLVSATANTAVFDDPNPGKPIFGTFTGTSYTGWETISNTDGDGSLEFNGDDEPVGFQVSVPNNQIFAALGSIDYGSDILGKDFVTIVTQRPVTPNAATESVTTITMLGAYGGTGRIGELNDAYDPSQPTSPTNPTSLKHDGYAGSVTRRARGGDTNLDGTINIADYATLETNYGSSGRQWYHGDYNGDGNVDIADYAMLEVNYGSTYTVYSDSNFTSGSGGGGGGTSPVPEPGTAALVGLGLLAAAGLRRRR